MFIIRRRSISILGCLLGSFLIVPPPTVLADDLNGTAPRYNLASFCGDYAVIGTYGANVARLIGTYHADGNGVIAGTAKVNLPGAGNSRVIVNISFGGNYEVSEDGTGIIYFTVELPGGGTAPATLDLVITKSRILGRTNVATEVATAQREPSSVVNGQFVTHISTRRPDSKRDRDHD